MPFRSWLQKVRAIWCANAAVSSLRVREPSRVQADLHKTGDREQAAYRSTLLQWLSPAVVSSYYYECDPVREGCTYMTPDFIEQSLKTLPTRNLERRLEGFYEGLLQVRTADAVKATVWVHRCFF